MNIITKFIIKKLRIREIVQDEISNILYKESPAFKRAIGNAIAAACNGHDLNVYGWGNINLTSIVKDSAVSGIKEELVSRVQKAVSETIKGEEFIDLVVERIKKKQLT